MPLTQGYHLSVVIVVVVLLVDGLHPTAVLKAINSDKQNENTTEQTELSQHNTQNGVQPNTMFKHIVHFQKCTKKCTGKHICTLLQIRGGGNQTRPTQQRQNTRKQQTNNGSHTRPHSKNTISSLGKILKPRANQNPGGENFSQSGG